MALRRFLSARGWPEVIYSNPGSQLVGAERELREAWTSVDSRSLHKKGAENDLTWVFAPADSPWYLELLSLWLKVSREQYISHFTIRNQRLSVEEFLTVCGETANLLNERPIGTLPSTDSEINILINP